MSQILKYIIDSRPTRRDHSIHAVYALVHISSDMVYVGSTRDLYHRVSDHFNALRADTHRNQRLQRAYDRNAHFEILYTPVATLEEARDLEQLLVDELAPTDKLLNIALDVRLTGLGVHRSLETRNKLREANTSQFSTEESRIQHSQISTKLWKDPEYRAKQCGQVRDPAARKRVSDGLRQKYKDDPEFAAKMATVRSKPITLDGVVYPSRLAAAKALGIPTSTLQTRLKQNRNLE